MGHRTRADALREPRLGVSGVPAVTGTRGRSGWALHGGPGGEAGGAEASWRTRRECARARGEAARAGWRERPVRSNASRTAYQWAASGGWPGDCPRVSTSSEGKKKSKRGRKTQNMNTMARLEENPTRKRLLGQRCRHDRN